MATEEYCNCPKCGRLKRLLFADIPFIPICDTVCACGYDFVMEYTILPMVDTAVEPLKRKNSMAEPSKHNEYIVEPPIVEPKRQKDSMVEPKRQKDSMVEPLKQRKQEDPMVEPPKQKEYTTEPLKQQGTVEPPQQGESENERWNKEMARIKDAPLNSPRTCPGCEGKGYQTRRPDGIRITCPMCLGSGTFIPPGTITFTAVPCVTPCPQDGGGLPLNKPNWPRPPYPYEVVPPKQPPYEIMPNPWRRGDYYVGDDPADWQGPPKVTC